MDVQDYFGGIDIYLFDQLQKGRLSKGMKLFDIGCGSGRNLIFFMKEGYDVYGIDTNKSYINNVRFVAKQLAPDLPDDNFRLESFSKISFDNSQFDFVICSAVLHYASDENEFYTWLKEAWRVLKVDGTFFCRLASTIGIEDKITNLEGRRYHLPDGSDRFLVDQNLLVKLTEQLNGEFIEPIKTTNVQNMRSMTTWVLRKIDERTKTDPRLHESRGISLFRE